MVENEIFLTIYSQFVSMISMCFVFINRITGMLKFGQWLADNKKRWDIFTAI